MPILNAKTFEFISRSAKQTRRLGARLGTLVQGGDVIALEGELGTGKTIFAQGLGRGWGANTHFVSPTYVLVRRHERQQDTQKIYHIDLYRLNSLSEIIDLGLEELFESTQSVCVVEWANRAANLFSDEHLWISLHWLDDYRRSMIFHANGPRHTALLSAYHKEILGK